jgi:phosphate transport system substrate-binding protein
MGGICWPSCAVMRLAGAAAAIGLALLSCGGSVRETRLPPTTLGVDGATALLPFLHPASVAFTTLHPDVTFRIESNSTGPGLARLIEKGDIAFASAGRRVKREEFESGLEVGKILHMTAVLAEGIVVVVHDQNPAANASVEQLKAVFFSGKITDWKDLTSGAKTGPIQVVALNVKRTAQGDMFTSTVGRGAPWVQGAKILDDPKDVPDAIKADPDAIGFVPQPVAIKGALRMLSVDGITATDSTVFDETYPLSRRLYWVTDGPPRGVAAEFIKFSLSQEGQHIARARGFTALALEH